MSNVNRGRLIWYALLFVVFTIALVFTIKDWSSDAKHYILAAVEAIMMIDSARAFIIHYKK